MQLRSNIPAVGAAVLAITTVFTTTAIAQFDRDWTIYVVPFSHTDVGFTDPVPVVIDQHNRYLDDVVAYVEQTRQNPEGERFKWTIEIPWVLESYIEERSPEEVEALMQLVRDGDVEIGGMHFGLQTDLTSGEELVQSLYLAQQIRERYDVPIRTVMLNDTPGATWSLAQILPKSGMPYLSLAMNSVLSEFYETTTLPYLFFWEAQSGDRLLVWRCIDTQWAYLEGIISQQLYGGYNVMKSRLTQLLHKLAEERYPYDYVYINAATGDNGPPRLEIVDNVNRWNEEHEDSRIRIATASEFFDAVSDRYADEIPIVTGDGPNWWSWFFAPSTTGGTSILRRAQTAIPEAEAFSSIAAMLNPAFTYPAGELRRAYVNSLLYSDHNLGGHTPADDAEFWPRKMEWVSSAYETATRLREVALDAIAGVATNGARSSVVVFNASGWKRSETVRVDAASGFRVIDVSTREERPSQLLSTGEVAFLAEQVPPLGYRMFEIVPDEDMQAEPGNGYVLENDFYRLEIDPAQGSVRSLVDKRISDELTRGDGRFNLYLFSGSGRPSGMQVAGRDSGAVLQRIVLRGDAPGSQVYETEVILYAGSPRVDFLNRYDKSQPGPFESVDFMYDFGWVASELEYEVPFGVVRLFDDEMPGFRTRHYGVQRWMNVAEGSGYAVTLATRETAVTAHTSGDFSGVMRMMASFNTTASGYRAGVGSLEAGFSITSGEASDPIDAVRHAYDFSAPLSVRTLPGPRQGFAPADRFSLFDFGSAEMHMTAFRQTAPGDYIIRLYNPRDVGVQASLTSRFDLLSVHETTPLEVDIAPVTHTTSTFTADFGPHEIKTYRLSLAVPTGREDETETPRAPALHQNYPNPFNPSTTIRYDVPFRTDVRVAIYDLLGRVITVLNEGPHQAGAYEVAWDGRDGSGRAVASGVYLYAIELRDGPGSRRDTKAMVLMK